MLYSGRRAEAGFYSTLYTYTLCTVYPGAALRACRTCPAQGGPTSAAARYQHFSLHNVRRRGGAHLGRGLVAQDRVDLVEDVGRELREDLERLEVIEHLLGLRRAEDDGARRREARDPRERELRGRAPELCRAPRRQYALCNSICGRGAHSSRRAR